jgi:hypothetical protein
MSIKRNIVMAMAGVAMATSANATLTVYPAPAEVELNKSFGVEVRQNGGAWQAVDVYRVFVDEVVGTSHKVKPSSMAYFDFDGTVDVRIVSNNRHVESARVRPLSYDIAHTVVGDTITFSLDRPRKLSIEVNGEIFDNLQLFANPLDVDAPTAKALKRLKKDKNYIYFGAGYHKLSEELVVGSNQTVYIAGGAYIDGLIRVRDAENVKICGRGMIYPHRNYGLSTERSKNVKISGVFTTQCGVGQSDSVTIENVKLMSYYGWGDGFNIFASNNVKYNDVFARNSDDCMTIYATRKNFQGGCKNILFENAILWADVAHPIEIGLHSETERLEVIEDAWFRNIDVLDMKEKQIDYQGVFAITCGDNNTVRNIHFEDVRVEDFREGKLIDIRICFNKKYCTAPGKAVEDIYFKNVSYNGSNAELSMIIGYDETRKVNGVHFENLMINGVKISDDMPGKPKWYKTGDMGRIFIGEHVENVTFD